MVIVSLSAAKINLETAISCLFLGFGLDVMCNGNYGASRLIRRVVAIAIVKMADCVSSFQQVLLTSVAAAAVAAASVLLAKS